MSQDEARDHDVYSSNGNGTRYMANPEHLAKLHEGVEVWNQWREENLVVPDLSNTDLHEMDFRGANFVGANFEMANLERADLEGASLIRALLRADLAGAFFADADLREAHLEGANLRGANLQEADLRGAYLMGAHLERAHIDRADLREADLMGAFLDGAILTGADLSGANLEEAYVGGTLFVDTHLADTIGLEACEHDGPSTLDHRTLAKSGTLPIAFLQGCGLSDLEIEFAKLYRKNLTDSQVTDIGYEVIRLRSDPAIQFHSCFISYSSKDDDFARRLHDGLQETGVRCWFAPEVLKIGDEFRNVIEDAVRLHDKVLLILSKASVKSEWVKDEVEAALEKERKRKPKQTVLFPIQIDDAIQRTRQAWAAKLRRQRHIGDFTHWKDHDQYNTAFQRLLRDLKA